MSDNHTWKKRSMEKGKQKSPNESTNSFIKFKKKAMEKKHITKCWFCLFFIPMCITAFSALVFTSHTQTQFVTFMANNADLPSTEQYSWSPFEKGRPTSTLWIEPTNQPNNPPFGSHTLFIISSSSDSVSMVCIIFFGMK